MRLIISATIAALALTGCDREAGSEVDTGVFGNASMNNMMVMTGERDYTFTLGKRFASEVPTTITFAFNSAVLDDAARQVLNQQANWIRQFPEIKFRVYGHTDAVGSASYNRRLGKQRADAVVRYLTAQGINRSRLDAVASFGETQPVIVTQDRERRNRRTVTEVTGFVERHPTVMDGKYAAIVYREYLASAVPPTGLTGTSTALQTGE